MKLSKEFTWAVKCLNGLRWEGILQHSFCPWRGFEKGVYLNSLVHNHITNNCCYQNYLYISIRCGYKVDLPFLQNVFRSNVTNM